MSEKAGKESQYSFAPPLSAYAGWVGCDNNRVLAYVSFSGSSGATVSIGSMTNGSFSSALTWAASCSRYAGV